MNATVNPPMTPRRAEPAGTGPGGPAGRRPRSSAGPSRGPQPAAATPDAVLLGMARAFAVLFLEVEAGVRPAPQLGRFMSAVLYARLATVWVARRSLGRVLTVTGWRTASDRYQAVVVVARGTRIGGLGLELAYRHGGWCVDDVARPEDGALPPPAWPVPLPEDEASPAACREDDRDAGACAHCDHVTDDVRIVPLADGVTTG